LLISGDSAGGGLAASVAALAGQNAIRLEGLALLSPWLDLTVTNDTYAVNAASDPLFSADAAQTGAEQYLQGHSSRDPLVSPWLGPVTRFPPVYVNVGVGEVLADDARHLHARLYQAGMPVQLHLIDGMEHVALLRGAALPGSEEAMEALVAFVDRVVRLDDPHPSG
jgi:acetyl esterase/lipase